MRSKWLLVVIVGLILLVTIPLTGCAEKPSASFVLKPSDVGQDWSYEVKIGKTTYGVNYPQFLQDGRYVDLGIRRVVAKDNTAIIEEIIQTVTVYPYLEEALNSIKDLRDNHQPLDIRHWDEVYLTTRSREESFEQAGLVLRKDNCVVHLYYREVLYKEDPITGKFYFSQYPPFNQEKAQWAEDLLRSLAEIIISRQ